MRKTTLTITEMLLEMAENLTDQSLSPKEIERQIERAQALSSIAEQVVNVKDVAIRELDVNMKAVKIAASMGLQYKPEGLELTALSDLKPAKKAIPEQAGKAEKADDLPEGYKGTDKKGVTPEGFKYEL